MQDNDDYDFDELLKELKGQKQERQEHYKESQQLVQQMKSFYHSEQVQSILKKYSWNAKTIQIIVIPGVIDHYGLRSANDSVIHYPGKSKQYDATCIEEISVDKFLAGRKHDLYQLKENEESPFSPKTVIERARSRIGESDYNLLFNNCEHFVSWCIYDQAESGQVRKGLSMLLAGHLLR